MDMTEEDIVREEQLRDNPLESLGRQELDDQIKNFHADHFSQTNSVTVRELVIGARLARNYGNHSQDADDSTDATDRRPVSISSSTCAANRLLGKPEWTALKNQESRKFWLEPKGLLVTLFTCCMASLTQGWNQVANGNLGWPAQLGLQGINDYGTGIDIWKFGAANAILWFSAALLGPCLLDPICHSSVFGRRGAVFIAAAFSFAATIGGSQATSWQGYLISRLFLGVGIGAKASIVPVWESEVLPPDKRGRLLISWQVFTATGIFAGSIATYILRDNWRSQVLSAAIPALILLITTYMGCESPRWLIIQGKYEKAFAALVQLRGERILAAEEFCYIHYQIQTERALLRKKPLNFNQLEDRISYSQRLPKLFTLARNRRAAISSMVVMLSQQFSGINILAFFASVFFSAPGLFQSRGDPVGDSLRLTIGFGVANAVFSVIAYFVIEPPEDDEDDSTPGKKKLQLAKRLRGRRSLLMISLGGGTAMLFVLTFLLNLNESALPSCRSLLHLLCYSHYFIHQAPAACRSCIQPRCGRMMVVKSECRGPFFGTFSAPAS